jgi:hypothetical protein
VTKLWQLMEMGGTTLWTIWFFSLICLLQIVGNGIIIVILYFNNAWHWFILVVLDVGDIWMNLNCYKVII